MDVTLNNTYLSCKYCLEYVHTDNYERHIKVCYKHYHDEQSKHLIYNNSQVPSGANINEFVRDHYILDDIIISEKPLQPAKQRIKRSLTPIKEDVPDNFECFICMENISDLENIKQMKCKHMFCSKCINKWLAINQTCPLCKSRVSNKDTRHIIKK